MKALLCTALILASAYSYGQETTIEKVSAPRTIRLVNYDSAASYFRVKFVDLPRTLSPAPMKLEQLSWSATHYPYADVAEQLEVCYYPYGEGRNQSKVCDNATPGATGTSSKFNSLRFGHESTVQVIHKVQGGRQTISPAGNDMISLRISYQ